MAVFSVRVVSLRLKRSAPVDLSSVALYIMVQRAEWACTLMNICLLSRCLVAHACVGLCWKKKFSLTASTKLVESLSVGKGASKVVVEMLVRHVEMLGCLFNSRLHKGLCRDLTLFSSQLQCFAVILLSGVHTMKGSDIPSQPPAWSEKATTLILGFERKCFCASTKERVPIGL